MNFCPPRPLTESLNIIIEVENREELRIRITFRIRPGKILQIRLKASKVLNDVTKKYIK